MEGKSQKMTTVESSPFDILPDELLQKILEQLPCKSAVQCKAVSRRWLCIISDPYFVQCSIHNHHHHLEQFSFLFHYCKYSKLHLGSTCCIPNLKTAIAKPHLLSFIPCFRELDFAPISVVAYFKDLLVCCNRQSFRTYYICNPQTKQWSMIPPCPNNPTMVDFESTMVGFVCYPYCCNKKQSCFTNSWYKYKLVCFPDYSNSEKFTTEVFDSESGTWSHSVVSSSQRLSIGIKTPLVIAHNGILHWLNEDRFIMTYDPLNNDERCRIIDPPSDHKYDCFGVCGGSLRIAQMDNLLSNGRLRVWELEDYNAGKWRLEYNFCLKDLVSEDKWLAEQKISSKFYVKIVAFHPFDGDIAYLCFHPFNNESYIVSCNMRKGTFKVVSKHQHAGERIVILGNNFWPLVHPWWPTPVPSLDHVEALSC